MCIMSHPIPSTNDSHSVQIILPQKQLNRRHGAPAAAALSAAARSLLLANAVCQGLPVVCASMFALNSHVLHSALTPEPTPLRKRP